MNLNMCFISVLSLSPECDYRSCHMVLGCFLGPPLCFLETIYPLSSTRKARRHLRAGTPSPALLKPSQHTQIADNSKIPSRQQLNATDRCTGEAVSLPGPLRECVA